MLIPSEITSACLTSHADSYMDFGNLFSYEALQVYNHKDKSDQLSAYVTEEITESRSVASYQVTYL